MYFSKLLTSLVLNCFFIIRRSFSIFKLSTLNTAFNIFFVTYRWPLFQLIPIQYGFPYFYSVWVKRGSGRLDLLNDFKCFLSFIFIWFEGIYAILNKSEQFSWDKLNIFLIICRSCIVEAFERSKKKWKDGKHFWRTQKEIVAIQLVLTLEL